MQTTTNKSLFIFSEKSIIRKCCKTIANHKYYQPAILVLIFLSCISLALENPERRNDEMWNKSLFIVEIVFTLLFGIEAIIKSIELGFLFGPNAYLQDWWNVLDFIVVISSVISVSITSINVGYLRSFRLLRSLRPLRVINRFEGLKLVINALFMSAGAIFNVMIILLIVWLIFGIVGVQLFKGEFYECSNPDFPPGGHKNGALDPETNEWLVCNGTTTFIHPDTGEEEIATWERYPSNFDNILEAMLTLFIMSTLEGWPDILMHGVDTTFADHQPKENSNPFVAYYFVIFILVGSFFFVNLFVGVIFDNFKRLKRDMDGLDFLTPRQRQWVETKKKLLRTEPIHDPTPPKHPFRLKIFNFIRHPFFDSFIMFCILINVIMMASTYEGEPREWSLTIEGFNIFFTTIFIVEAALKIIGLGAVQYWDDKWNRFDFILVVGSLIDIMFNAINTSIFRVFRVGRILARVFRILRVSRVFRLFKALSGLRILTTTLIYSLPSLVNVGALLILLFFIYAILGVFIFAEVEEQEVLDRYTNFKSFDRALQTLLHTITGEVLFLSLPVQKKKRKKKEFH